MHQRRSFDEHAALFVEFGNRVSRLTPEAWNRLSARCAAFNGPEFSALLARTALGATPYKLPIPSPVRDRLSLRIIAGATRAVVTSMFFAGEVATEFERVTNSPPLRRTTSTGNPVTDAYVDAAFLIESALAPRNRSQPGVATVVRAASQAVLRHDWLPPEDFEAVYKYIEPDIPFDELRRQ